MIDDDDGLDAIPTSKQLSKDDFLKRFAEFRVSLRDLNAKHELPSLETEEEVDLFRLWHYDTREQELIAEGRARERMEREEDRGF